MNEQEREIKLLRESEEKYRKMIAMANDAIFIVDTEDAHIVEANAKAEEITGLYGEKLLGRPVWEMHPPDELEKARDLFYQVVETGLGSISRLHCLRPDGSCLPVEVSASKITIGGRAVIMRICRDITNRVEKEEHRRHLQDFFRNVMEMMPVGIGVRDNINRAPIVVYENSKLKEMFQSEGDASDRVRWCDCPNDETMETRELLGANGVYGIEKRLPDSRVFLFTSNYFRDPQNDWHELQVVQDISVHRQLEDELRRTNAELEDRVTERTRELQRKQSQLMQAEKMASLGNLVAGVAHEINTPLGALKSNNDLFIRSITKMKTLLTDPAMPDVVRSNEQLLMFFESIEQLSAVNKEAAGRIVDIVSSLRDFARLDQAEKDRVDIHEGLENTLALVHHQLKNRVEVIRDYSDLPNVYCHPNQLNQVFMNILVNASQAIEGPGTIRITTRRDGDDVVIAFADSGKGIPQDVQKRIFDPGFTTKGAGVGTGLGLSIVHQIIQSHKGDISVHSESGHGTIFTIRLPIDEKNGENS